MACKGQGHNLSADVSRETLLYNTNKSEVVVRSLTSHNGVMNNKEIHYQAEAKKILDLPEDIAIAVLISLMKDAGWVPEKDGRWLRTKV